MYKRQELYGTADKAVSFWSQLNRAYLRLATEELGWELLDPQHSERQLSQYDQTGNMREVMTPQGEALVYARLQGGGTSTMTVQRIVNRLRSNALLHGFEIYILTPSAERGKSRAEQHDSFLHVLTVNPVHEKLAHVKRVKKPAHGERTTDPSPVIPPDWRGQELREQWAALPERSLDILGLTTEKRIEQAMLALECDHVLSDAQLKKHFGLRPEDLPKVRLVKTIIRPTFGATAQEEICLLYTSPSPRD